MSAAARGLERLSAADMRRDLRPLLTGDSILSQCAQAFTQALRDLSDAQVDALLKEQPVATGDLLRDGLRQLRSATNQPVFEAMAPTLDVWWEQGLKQHVAAALQEQLIDRAQAFRDGLKTYQNSLMGKAEAARLFNQAAERGHPGAQYFLGMMHEKGEGVPKDRTLALSYYTQSATNGYDEAAMTLGNLYNDGIGVKQDYAEAFVWFSVAAARHHRFAEMFRNRAEGKLTTQDLAKAKKRVADLLKTIPPPPDAAGPSKR